MTKEEFEKLKVELIDLLNIKIGLNNQDRFEYEALLNVLKDYRYSNRNEDKGRLTRLIIDSLDIQNTLFDRFVKFDEGL